jgi:hypothetical protein
MYTFCVGIEENGSRCLRIKRVGDYCWFHNTEDPNICCRELKKGKRKGQICGKHLAFKQEMLPKINGSTTDPEGLFEDECAYHLRHPQIKKE